MSLEELWSRYYVLIGPAGLVLILLGITALFLGTKTFLYLWFTGFDFHRAAKGMSPTTDSRDGILMRFAKNPIIAIINDVIHTHGQHSDDLKAEVAYLFHRYFAKAQRDITFIRVIAVISPMLGLLGTLLGLLGVFQALSQTTAVATSTVLAAGIWEAIITTVMGLTLAIPCLIVYYLLSLKLRSFHLVSIEYGYRFLECRQGACTGRQLDSPPAQAEAGQRVLA
jgi:Biopolymer transport proteins